MPENQMIMNTARRSIAIIGGGPAGLMAAEHLAQTGHQITVYDRMPSMGRKLLMAGRGGLNLTHSEDITHFLAKYHPQSPCLTKAVQAFPPSALRVWADDLGAETFVGTSGRVFPRALKASPLLRAWLRRLETLGVVLHTHTNWQGWDDDGNLCFKNRAGELFRIKPDVTLLALGGASWPKLGSDGEWCSLLQEKQVRINPLRPSNCGFHVQWSALFSERFAGTPLKSARFSFEGNTVRSEAVVTREGIEGSAIYALSGKLRDVIDSQGHADLILDLAPDIALDDLRVRLSNTRKKETLSNRLRKAAHLSPLAISLLREGPDGIALPHKPEALAALVKAYKLRLIGTKPITKAISSAGGIRFEDLDDYSMIRALPGVFAAGEMLDWEAPTGGYLLQACFSNAIAAAHGIIHWLDTHPSEKPQHPSD